MLYPARQPLRKYFKLALSTNVFDYVEHRYARMELNRLRELASSDLVSEE